MYLKAVELFFADEDRECPHGVKTCACRHVLVNVNTLAPIYAHDECMSEAILQEVDAKISGLGGVDRLVACFHVFLKRAADAPRITVDLQASSVSLHFVQWKHKRAPLSADKCGCGLCKSRFPGFVEPVSLQLLPIAFLTACEGELRRRAAAWEARYAWIATADLAARRQCFKPDANPEAECVDFTEGSGVSCIQPSPTHADVYTTMPMMVRVRSGEILTSHGALYAHNIRQSSTHLHISVAMSEHEELHSLGNGVSLLIAANAPTDKRLPLRDHLRMLSNSDDRTIATDNFGRVVDGEIPALCPRKGPRPWFPRLLGSASRKRKAECHREVPELLPVLLGESRAAVVQAECEKKFAREADGHAFAVLLGALAPVRLLQDKVWFALVELIEEGSCARVRALHASVACSSKHTGEAQTPAHTFSSNTSISGWSKHTGEAKTPAHTSSSNTSISGGSEHTGEALPTDYVAKQAVVCAELAGVVVPLLFLEMVHDAFCGGPMWCAPSSPMQHKIIKDTSMVNGGTALRDELTARGIGVAGLSLAQQRQAFEHDVFSHVFCDRPSLCPIVAQWRAAGVGQRRIIRELVATAKTWLGFLNNHGMCHATRCDVVDTVMELLSD